jgi:hypothetical protein
LSFSPAIKWNVVLNRMNKVEGLNSQVLGASVYFDPKHTQRAKRSPDHHEVMLPDMHSPDHHLMEASMAIDKAAIINGPRIKFRNLQPIDPSDRNGTVLCSYWNNDARVWATDGCRMELMTETEVHCVCNHLTNFAVLMDINGAMAMNEVRYSCTSIYVYSIGQKWLYLLQKVLKSKYGFP